MVQIMKQCGLRKSQVGMMATSGIQLLLQLLPLRPQVLQLFYSVSWGAEVTFGCVLVIKLTVAVCRRVLPLLPAALRQLWCSRIPTSCTRKQARLHVQGWTYATPNLTLMLHCR